MGYDAAFEFAGVTKAYGPTPALTDVSFRAGRGEIVLLLGPNGAGKTTTTTILTGVLRPDRGSVRVCGDDPTRASTRRHLGAVTQYSMLPPTMTVRELVDFTRIHYLSPRDAEPLLEEFGLKDVQDVQIRRLSGGYWRRASVCAAFAGRPNLLVLDEPTAGLDVESRRALSRSIARFADQGGTVLMTTHLLNDVQQYAHRVVLLKHGRVAFDGRVGDFIAGTARTAVTVDSQRLPALPPDVRVEASGGRQRIFGPNVGEVLELLVRNGVSLRGVELSAPTLEDAFINVSATQLEPVSR